jgi:hypothetical protein
VILQHGNSQTQTTSKKHDVFEMGREAFQHFHYRLNLVSRDFQLLGLIKKSAGGKTLNDDEKVRQHEVSTVETS